MNYLLLERSQHHAPLLREALTIYLGDEYYSDVCNEFNAYVMTNVPYMKNTLRWGQFQRKIDYVAMRSTLGNKLMKLLIESPPSRILERIELIRAELLSLDLAVDLRE
jgi:hypothetical protein